MVRVIIIICFFILGLYAQNSYYDDKVSQFQILSFKSKPIMMIGDSITDRGLWNELLDRNDIVNRGISGDTTIGLLNRIAINNIDVKKVFLMIGINDLLKGKSVEYVYENYLKILSYYQSNRITPIVQSTIFVNDTVNSDINLKVKQLNILLKNYSKTKNIIFIDLNKVLSPNGFLDSQYTNDRLHLNGNGYQLWADTIKKYLD
ncbi:GDSL-type esterase/lipase family protein [Aliarcobacter cryaerophilus]|uniref:GDSL-type esterase/lipase family protein n=1 Tax=Aliarcobacter cryaerophilus TaxID=28198 RepID=UPI003DA426BB